MTRMSLPLPFLIVALAATAGAALALPPGDGDGEAPPASGGKGGTEAAPDAPDETGETAKPSRTPFVLPCEDYRKGLRGEGNFGILVTKKGTVFSGTHHLGEDVWLKGGTRVVAVADGIVRWSDFSPTWTGPDRFVHWNLGNAIVLEHEIAAEEGEPATVCSVYFHLAADRKVAVGERVKRGQLLGTIGANRSDENGRYPAHLHFGIHKGPYIQVSPAWRRELEAEARGTGIVAGPGDPIKGEIEIERTGESSVIVREKGGKRFIVLSLLVGSTAPDYRPADIIGWCQGYGDKATVDEWLRPSTWIAARLAVQSPRVEKPER